MRRGKIRQVRPLEQPPVRFRSLNEALGDNRRRRDAALLKLYAVVETPRCAGASIGDTVQDDAALLRERLDDLRTGAHPGIRFLLPDKPHPTDMSREAFLQTVEDFGGAVLVVVE